ncbi:MAG: hypothetical protein AB1899_08065 [Pseudomonadota bacterium]
MLHRLLFLAFILSSAALPVQAGRLLDLEIVNRASGEVLDVHRHRGRLWVAGNPGERYALRLVNRTAQRVLVVLAVDGINVINGATASPDQTGYVLGPWERAEIAGWRKSMSEVARFYFTALPDSYAARTDRPDNVGIIGAAVFREKTPPPPVVVLPQAGLPAESALESQALGSASADAARSRPAPAGAAVAKSARQAERLGTGHGERQYAPISYTDFERAGSRPDELISVGYDSRENLTARGILPAPRPAWPEPQPFPGTFVPDPRG